MPREWTWWTWLITALFLTAGLAGHPAGLVGGIAISVLQTFVFLNRHRSIAAFPVQIRLAYTALLLVCWPPPMRWLYWLPTLGTFALVLFGYCLMARFPSLMTWNREQPLCRRLLLRAFLSPPSRRHPHHGLPDAGPGECMCSLEARVAYGASARQNSQS